MESLQAIRGKQVEQNIVEANPDAEEAFVRRVPVWVVLTIIAVLVAVFVVSFALGGYPLNPTELMLGLYNHFFNVDAINADNYFLQIDKVLFNIRLPRIGVCLMVGGSARHGGCQLSGHVQKPFGVSRPVGRRRRSLSRCLSCTAV